jgi:hypothetical protein
LDSSACISQLLVGIVTLFLVVSAGVYLSKGVEIPSRELMHAAATK